MNRPRSTLKPAMRMALGFVFLWFFIGGIGHFVFTEAEMRIVPPYIPWPRGAVLGSGVFELLGAVGLLWQPTRRLAAWGLFALTLAVTPAHVYMLQQPALLGAGLAAALAGGIARIDCLDWFKTCAACFFFFAAIPRLMQDSGWLRSCSG
jgi:uncharacterized membrane protein